METYAVSVNINHATEWICVCTACKLISLRYGCVHKVRRFLMCATSIMLNSDHKLTTTRTCIEVDEASFAVRVCWSNTLTVSPVRTSTITEVTIIITNDAASCSARNAANGCFRAAVPQRDLLLLLQVTAAWFDSAGRGARCSTG
jgi:hypothetical protein